MVRNYIASVLISIISSNVSSAQIGKICNWDSGKMAAIVLTFDDWSPGHYPIVVPELRNRDLVATFFPIITSIAPWNHPWPDVDMTTSYGNEIGNHTRSHPHLTDTATAISNEIRGAKSIIDSNLSSQSVISFDYPYGDFNDMVVDSVKSTGHIAARGVYPITNYSYNFAAKENDYYKLQTFGMNTNSTTKDFSEQLEKVIQGGGLLNMYHSIDDVSGTYNDNWYARVLEDSLQKQLDVLVSVKDKTWVTTLGKAIKYHREARCAQLTEVSAFDGEQWVVNLTDTLSVNSLYNQPLSVKLKMNGVEFTEISQNGNDLTIDSVYNDTILFKAIPDGGTIALSTLKLAKETIK
jgi:peptidoglycan/xylan/chitin deacetylase (PgdA/CDA1 family)